MEIDIKTIVGSYAQITLFLLMLSLGLKEGVGNLTLLWRQPWLLIRCLIASFILVPLAAIAIDLLFPLDPEVRLGMGAMAICPGAPLLYRKLSTLNADPTLAGSFQVTTSLFAIVVVPTLIVLIDVFYLNNNVTPVGVLLIGKQIATAQFIPILLGLAIYQWLPNLGNNVLEPLEKISLFLLLGLLVIVLILTIPQILQIGVVTIAAIILFVAAMIAIGHYMGGRDPETRISIALANSSRNAGLALVLVALNINIQENLAALATIAAIALLAALVGAIYVNIYRKSLPPKVDTDLSSG